MKLNPIIALAALLPVQALAQDYDDYDDYDEDRSVDEEVLPQREEVVREVVKGLFAKANVGTTVFLGSFASNGATKAGTATTIGIGSDFVDQERFSMAWEVSFMQGIHNGMPYDIQADSCQHAGGVFPCHQGDLRTYSFIANLEASTYPTRRIGIGGRVGAGLLISPLLIDDNAYQTEVIPEFEGIDPGWHSGAKPIFAAGPTFEYYSKLSHFSVGIDVDVFYGIGWDLGMNATGYFKDTF
ncbi:MAG: adventurous gliding motility protein CglE [Myxococcota bacterium]|nr:adventurous gliding motility protein CglE [Myxococcota bacterium]